jgi:transcriptional regulator with XRE-family HTH domain
MPPLLRNTQFHDKQEITYCGMGRFYVLRNSVGMVPNRLKEIRKQHSLGQKDVAAAMGVSIPQISRWEVGEDAIPSTRLRAMAEAYKATIGEIFEAPIDPSEDDLARMVSEAHDEIRRTVPIDDWPRAVASNLRLQLSRFRADRRRTVAATSSAHNKGARPPAATKRDGQA